MKKFGESWLTDVGKKEIKMHKDNVLTLAEARANVRKKTAVRCIVCN